MSSAFFSAALITARRCALIAAAIIGLMPWTAFIAQFQPLTKSYMITHCLAHYDAVKTVRTARIWESFEVDYAPLNRSEVLMTATNARYSCQVSFDLRGWRVSGFTDIGWPSPCGCLY